MYAREKLLFFIMYAVHRDKEKNKTPENPLSVRPALDKHFLIEVVDFGVSIHSVWFALPGTNKTHVEGI